MKFTCDKRYSPPAPSVEIQIGLPGEELARSVLTAFVDTGADTTIIPLSHIERLNAQVDSQRHIRSQWGEHRQVYLYLVNIVVAGIRLSAVEVVADEMGAEIIVGRNVLNKLVISLDGPKRIIEILE